MKQMNNKSLLEEALAEAARDFAKEMGYKQAAKNRPAEYTSPKKTVWSEIIDFIKSKQLHPINQVRNQFCKYERV